MESGNTQFFRDTADIQQNFKWGQIFADMTKTHTKEQKDRVIGSGLTRYAVKESDMLKEWQKPWLSFRFLLFGLFLVAMIFIGYAIFSDQAALTLMAIYIPPFVMPLATLLFFWEMNIPRNITLADLAIWAFFGGMLSIVATFMLMGIFEYSGIPSLLATALFEELAKVILVVFFLRKENKYNYGLNGIVIGGAIGVGFAAMESVMYAYIVLTGTGSMGSAILNWAIRSILCIGGHTVWAAMYGGALALAKGKDRFRWKYLGNPLFLLTWLGAFILHLIWDFDLAGFFGRFADSRFMITIYVALEKYYIRYIILVVLAWVILLHVMRLGIRQVVASCQYAAMYPQAAQQLNMNGQSMPQQQYGNPMVGQAVAQPAAGQVLIVTVQLTAKGGLMNGKMFTASQSCPVTMGRAAGCTVLYPDGTKGISSNHCEIKWKEGFMVLIDRGSTYGTFFSNGQKLQPNVPYKLQNGTAFYLAEPVNQFTVKM